MKASPDAPHLSNQEPVIDLFELYDVLRAGWKLIGVTTAACFLFSIFYASTRTEIYRAEALLASLRSAYHSADAKLDGQ